MNECIEARKAIHDRYFERLDGIPGIILCQKQKDVESNFAYFPVLFDKNRFGKNRDEVYVELCANDIYPRKYFYPAINDMECYKDYKGPQTPIAHDAAENILTLPIYEGLSPEDVDSICSIILK